MELPLSEKNYIICVDDEQAVLNQLSIQIGEAFGEMCLVESAESAEEALEVMEELASGGGRILIMISDQVMPDMKGDQLLEIVHQKYPLTKKILLTGYAGLDSAMYAINNAGLDNYLEKPWDRDKLLVIIQELLDASRVSEPAEDDFHVKESLQNVQIFRTLPNDAINLIAEKLQLVTFRKDVIIFTIDDPGDCMYIIKSGEVKVIAGTDENDEVLAYLGRGNYFGEMALLTEEPRSASVIASMDSELLMLTKVNFDYLIKKHPSIAITLSHVLSQRLRDISIKKAGRQNKIICLLNALSAEAEQKIVINLARKLLKETNGKVVVIDLDPSASQRPALKPLAGEERDSRWIVQHLDNIQEDELTTIMPEDSAGVDFFLPPAENDYPLSSYAVPLLSLLKEFYNFVLVHVKTDHQHDNNVTRIMEQASTVLYLVKQGGDAFDGSHRFLRSLQQEHKELLKKIEMLVMREQVVPGTAEALSPFIEPYHIHFLRVGQSMNFLFKQQELPSGPGEGGELPQGNRDVGRIARRLGNVSVGLVLGGGGARAYAHLGMLKVFQEEGIPIDILAGTSMGAFLGALFIMGKSVEEILEISRENWKKLNSPFSWTLPRIAFIKGKRIRNLVHDIFGDVLIEELPIPFLCVAGDLVSGQEVVLRNGKLYKAILASGALPGFFAPVRRGNMYLVDGGVVNNVPGDVLKKQGIDMVIAVDVTPEREVYLAPREEISTAIRSESNILRRAFLHVKRFRSKFGTVLLPRIIMRVIAIEGLEITRTKSRHFDIHIKPNLEDFDLFDFKRLPEIVVIGEQAGHREIAKIRETIELLKR